VLRLPRADPLRGRVRSGSRGDGDLKRTASRACRVGSIEGIVVRLDWSIVVIFRLLMWSLAVSGPPEFASDYSAVEYWLVAVVTTMAFFASLLAPDALCDGGGARPSRSGGGVVGRGC
jgi:hypothetical protein